MPGTDTHTRVNQGAHIHEPRAHLCEHAQIHKHTQKQADTLKTLRDKQARMRVYGRTCKHTRTHAPVTTHVCMYVDRYIGRSIDTHTYIYVDNVDVHRNTMPFPFGWSPRM